MFAEDTTSKIMMGRLNTVKEEMKKEKMTVIMQEETKEQAVVR